MEPLDITQEDDAGHDIPEAPHVEIMFDALNDTIAGNEGLTQAQHYALGVLSANGYRNVPAVAGNESFFGSISTGAKNAYDYIVKMFKSVWGFFFNRDAVKEADEAKNEIKQLDQELTDAVGGKSDEQVQATLKKVANIKPENVPGSYEAEFEKFLVGLRGVLHKEAAPGERLKTLKEFIGKAPHVNIKAQGNVKLAVEKVVDINKKFIALVTNADTEIKQGTDKNITKLAVAIVSDVAKFVPHANKTIADLSRHQAINDLNEAKQVHTQAQAEIEANRALALAIKSHTNALNEEIKFYEGLLEEDVKGTHTALHLTLLRGILTFSTNVAQYLKRSFAALVRLSKTVNAVFAA